MGNEVGDKPSTVEGLILKLSDKVDTVFATLSANHVETTTRLSRMEDWAQGVDQWRKETNERLNKHSIGAKDLGKQTSDADLSVQKELADEIVERKEADTEQERKIKVIYTVASKVDHLIDKPFIKLIILFVTFVITTYLAAHGVQVNK